MAFVVNILLSPWKSRSTIKAVFSSITEILLALQLCLTAPSAGQCPGYTDGDSAQESPRRPESWVLSSPSSWGSGSGEVAMLQPPPRPVTRPTSYIRPEIRRTWKCTEEKYFWFHRFHIDEFISIRWGLIIICRSMYCWKVLAWKFGDQWSSIVT